MISMKQTDVSGCKPVMERAGCKDVRGYMLTDYGCKVLFSVDPSAPGGHYEYHVSVKIDPDRPIAVDELICALNQIQPANWNAAQIIVRSDLLNFFAEYDGGAK